ncbi:hypothetical protein ABE237_00680 [Brevibacillus formosus]|uniref:hypothetical protein n=1 Tax=Brevibacillus formosus TaxID=54913 RepID=UPI0018CD22DF|nr:hypothetical protein [Brevibacillus formosus]MBG9944665.1 hypothetical protein [Brevibacillus formosus]
MKRQTFDDFLESYQPTKHRKIDKLYLKTDDPDNCEHWIHALYIEGGLLYYRRLVDLTQQEELSMTHEKFTVYTRFS